MITAGSFWNNLEQFTRQHSQFGLLLAIVLLVIVMLWRNRPQDHKQIADSLMFLAIALTGLALSGVFAAVELPDFAITLHEISVFAAGMVFIRVFGLFLFRIVLPIFHISFLRIFEDLSELAGYCTWLLVLLHNAGLEVTGIITTSAVMTAVLAFAMQDTLGNVLGGLALQLDNSISIGDWVSIDGVEGRVADIRWRYTAVETRSWETVIIPNSQLMKAKFSVLGRRAHKPLQWRRWIYFDIGYEYSTGLVIEITQNAVRNGHLVNVANMPPAICFLIEFCPSSVRYALCYWLTDIEHVDPTDSAIRSCIFAALLRAGIKMPYPKYDIHLTNNDEAYQLNAEMQRIEERMEAIRGVELFDFLHANELAEMAEHLVYTPFAKGDVLTRQGKIAHCLYIISSGIANVFLELPDGGRKQIETIKGACILGEMGLMTGDPRSATVIAQTEVIAYRLDKDTFQKILERRPELAEELSKLLVSRRGSIEYMQQQHDAENEALMVKQQHSILEKIRSFFTLDANHT